MCSKIHVVTCHMTMHFQIYTCLIYETHPKSITAHRAHHTFIQFIPTHSEFLEETINLQSHSA